jgi:NTP pyrophosphatase (non-canonical NTP hydrolase)
VWRNVCEIGNLRNEQLNLSSKNPASCNWLELSRSNHARFIKRAQTQGNLNTEAEIVEFLALALCGEAGEFANFIKKMWRGDTIDTNELRKELADVRTYVEHLAEHLHFDLDQACLDKATEVAERLDKLEAKDYDE